MSSQEYSENIWRPRKMNEAVFKEEVGRQMNAAGKMVVQPKTNKQKNQKELLNKVQAGRQQEETL